MVSKCQPPPAVARDAVGVPPSATPVLRSSDENTSYLCDAYEEGEKMYRSKTAYAHSKSCLLSSRDGTGGKL